MKTNPEKIQRLYKDNVKVWLEQIQAYFAGDNCLVDSMSTLNDIVKKVTDLDGAGSYVLHGTNDDTLRIRNYVITTTLKQ